MKNGHNCLGHTLQDVGHYMIPKTPSNESVAALVIIHSIIFLMFLCNPEWEES